MLGFSEHTGAAQIDCASAFFPGSWEPLLRLNLCVKNAN